MDRRLLLSFLFLCFVGMGTLLSQALTVRGQVTAADNGETLIGVNILVKGSSSGTVTDIDGNYELSVPSSDAVLIISYTGFATVEVPVAGQSSLNIALKADVAQLEEIVVTGTAAGQSKKTLSFSVGRIGEDLINTVPAPNVGSGLQGKIAGLRVNQVSGQPGQGAFFQIRSANALANGQQPLIIVDGIYLNGSTLADINPEDIERVEVLKGSAGAALYGSQAANGVIQIFTKRGKGMNVGETKITYRGEVGYAETINRIDINNFTNLEVLDPNGPQPTLGNPTADNIHNTPLPNLQDYQEDVLFQRGLFHSNYLAIQGRSAKTNFLASVQRLEDKGILKLSEGYSRNTFRVNVDHQISDKVDVQVSSMYSTSEQDLIAATANGPSSFISNVLFLTPIFDLEDSVNEEDGTPFDFDIDNTGLGTSNPFYDRVNSEQTVNRTRLLGSFRLNYYLTNDLTLSYSAALDRSTNEFEHFVRKGYLNSNNIPGLFNTLAAVGGASNGGGIHRSRRINNSFISRANLTYQKSFGDWNTAFRASYLYEDLVSEFNEGIGENLAVEGIRSLDNARSNIFVASEKQQIVANSYFVVADIDFQQKYIFSGLIRREGSSLFGPDERWANYFRLSGAYRLTEDISISGIDEFKIRASIGTAGIRPTFEQRFETFELINGTTTKNTLGNNILKPSFSQEIELGFNAVIASAFNLEFNYSNIKTEDQILLVPLTGASGFQDGKWLNAGTIEANVIELGLNTNFSRLLKLGNFKWDLNITFDRITQDIAELNVPPYTTGPGIQNSSLFQVAEGIPFGTMVGEVFATSLDQLAGQEGIDPNDYTVNKIGYVVRKDQENTSGEVPYKLVDEFGNPIVQQIGDINPDFRMGFANTFGYKGFKLYTLFDLKKGGDIYNLGKQWLYRDQRHGDASRDGIAASFYGSNGLYNVLVPNNHFVEDGSFFMLREAALSYEFAKNQLNSLFGNAIESLRISVIGRNLFTVTDYSGFHPDITGAPRDENTLSNRVADSRGSDAATPNGDPSVFLVDAFNYPVPRTVTFSLQLTF